MDRVKQNDDIFQIYLFYKPLLLVLLHLMNYSTGQYLNC